MAELLTDEGGEETGVPGENPWRQASKNATYYSPKIQAPSETRTRTIALVAGEESRHANRYTTRRTCYTQVGSLRVSWFRKHGFRWRDVCRLAVVSVSGIWISSLNRRRGGREGMQKIQMTHAPPHPSPVPDGRADEEDRWVGKSCLMSRRLRHRFATKMTLNLPKENSAF